MNLCKMLILLLVIPTQEGSAHSFLFIILINHPPSNSTFHSCCHSNYSSLCHSDYSSLCHSDYSTPFVIPTQEESAHSFLFTILINHPPSNSTFHSCCHSNYYSLCHSDAGGIYLFTVTPFIHSLCHSDYSLPLSFRRRRNLFIHHHSTYSSLLFQLFIIIVIPTFHSHCHSDRRRNLFIHPLCHSDAGGI